MTSTTSSTGTTRSARALAALVAGGVALGVLVLAAPATQASERVCPTDDYIVGDGWGADRGSRSHMGIDLGGERGTPIRAIEDGVIDRTKRQDNGALQIVMKGVSGAKFYYGHMDKVLVDGGQRVQAGDIIGTMGDSGSPGAVHLHFEYWRSGGESDAVDPAELISRVCSARADRGDRGDRADGGSRGGRPDADRPAAKRPQVSKAVKGDVFAPGS
jgi:murein DD-endopeptidase MepM/ murein hydrolase activator NlpD